MRYHVLREAAGETLEAFLLHSVGVGPRAALKKALLARLVLVNGSPGHRTDRVREGDVVELHDPGAAGVYLREDLSIAADAGAPLAVVLESPRLVVVAKPAGQSAHPLRPDETGTTLGALVARYPETARACRPDRPLEGALVHRLDRGTSGLLVCARSTEAFAELRDLWTRRSLEKVYLAWVAGRLDTTGRLELRLMHDPKSRARMMAAGKDEKAWAAVTSLAPVKTVRLESGGETTLVALRLHTGVMHQIRATLATLGAPVLGDTVYPARAAREVSPLALDPETAALFSRLKPEVKGLARPLPAKLPPRAFFLHALWLRSSEHADLEDGVRAAPPAHFGGSG